MQGRHLTVDIVDYMSPGHATCRRQPIQSAVFAAMDEKSLSLSSLVTRPHMPRLRCWLIQSFKAISVLSMPLDSWSEDGANEAL